MLFPIHWWRNYSSLSTEIITRSSLLSMNSQRFNGSTFLNGHSPLCMGGGVTYFAYSPFKYCFNYFKIGGIHDVTAISPLTKETLNYIFLNNSLQNVIWLFPFSGGHAFFPFSVSFTTYFNSFTWLFFVLFSIYFLCFPFFLYVSFPFPCFLLFPFSFPAFYRSLSVIKRKLFLT